ncbi:hypothetical protein BDR03DRAFT_981149 [Suillus americanus]|nr:hypothetical protein BDR03DRAFT_981149 [Suillus americanus]
MGSDVFNENGTMGTVPKRIISQADFFWARFNAIAPAPVISPVIATAVPPNPAVSASTGVGQKLKVFLRTAIEGVMNVLRVVLHVDLHAAKKFATIVGWRVPVAETGVAGHGVRWGMRGGGVYLTEIIAKTVIGVLHMLKLLGKSEESRTTA